ncbi:MAG TPA: phenylacetic acid degradation operon negative regulatory protein PaaX [Steroidobacteraceae bacterium]|nr:phenylacetic acid degradation operon negative regulatory protein PaaX [Steroidobacteraceae bacterium]
MLRHFRAQRPLRGGSLLVTIFGDAIAPRGGIVTLGSLIRLAAPFGLSERLVRTAAARLAREGWLAAERSGRRSEYRLSRAGAVRFAEATRRIYAPAPPGWDGRWTLLMLPAAGRRPAQLREGLKWLGFGQLSAAVFAHPGTTPGEARRWLLKMPGAADALLLHAQGVDAASERRLAAQGWDLAQLGRRYQRFLERFQPLLPILQRGGISAERAFLVRTLLIHEYRKIHLQDPLLPLKLLPADWVGRRAYELTRGLYAAVVAAAELHLSESARRLEGPLPPAAQALQRRFARPQRA